jgi:integrase
MVLKMARPTRRAGSSLHQFKQRIPLDVRDKAARKMLVVPVGDTMVTCQIGPTTQTIQFSLRTRDPDEARVRQAVALAHVEGFWRALRDGPIRLSQKQVIALSGEVYKEAVARNEADPGPPEGWEWLHALSTAPIVGSGLRIPLPGENAEVKAARTAPSPVDRVLARHGLVVDDDSRSRLLTELRKVIGQAALRLRDNALGDYGHDKNAERFPPLELASPKSKLPGGDVTLTGLVELWWGECKAVGMAESTYVNYRGTIRKFVAFLRNDDATRVTTQHVLDFKDHRLANGIGARTVKDGDLAGLRSVFGWAVANQKLPMNPAAGVSIKRSGKRKLERPKEFTDEEAKAVLLAATAVMRGAEREETWLAKRWVPWLLAYTGARVGEIVQLRKQDLQRRGAHWEIVITPEAGTVKGGEFRHVPLHPHLVELGFPAMVQSATEGHLFVRPNHDTGDVLGPLKGAINRVTEFVRLHVPDTRVSPNHAWRHRFITLCREHDVSEELRSMIVGHTGSTVAARDYGGPAGLYREICKLPKIDLDKITEALV